MAKARLDIQALLEQFNEDVRRSATPSERRGCDVDECARNPFPDCKVCMSLLDPDAIRLIAALAHPDAPRA